MTSKESLDNLSVDDLAMKLDEHYVSHSRYI